MDKETLSHYGWIVVLILVLSVMLALATPFGDYVGNGVVSIARGFVGTGNTALSDDNIDNLGNKYDDMLNACSHENTQKVNEKEETCETDGYTGDIVCTKCNKVLTKGQVIPKLYHKNTEIKNKTDTYTGDVYCKDCGKLLQKGEEIRPTIPDGGVYYVGVTDTGLIDENTKYTKKYGPGKKFPQISNGDAYVYGDYEYRYKKEIEGWHVRVKSKTKSEYQPILTEINGKPITSLNATFDSCRNLEKAPAIPETVVTMVSTFYGCWDLVEFPDINNCQKLKDIFSHCSSVKDASNMIIPSTVTNAEAAFHECSSLITAPDMSKITGRINVAHMFEDCSSLVYVRNIPSKCTDMTSMFNSCSSLVDASNIIIPETATDLCSLFRNCSQLTGSITINTTEDTLNWSTHVPLQNVLTGTKITSVYQILGKLERDRKQQIIDRSSY